MTPRKTFFAVSYFALGPLIICLTRRGGPMCPPDNIPNGVLVDAFGRTHGSAPTGYPGAPRYCTISATSRGI